MKNTFVLIGLVISAASFAQAKTPLSLPQLKANGSIEQYSKKRASITYDIDRRDCNCVETSIKTGKKTKCDEKEYDYAKGEFMLSRNASLWGGKQSLGIGTVFGPLYVYDSQPNFSEVKKLKFGVNVPEVAFSYSGDSHSPVLSSNALEIKTYERGFDNKKGIMFNSTQSVIEVAGIKASAVKQKLEFQIVDDKTMKFRVIDLVQGTDTLPSDKASAVKTELKKIKKFGKALTKYLFVGDADHSVVSTKKVMECTGRLRSGFYTIVVPEFKVPDGF